MFNILQTLFTVATMALAVPIFMSYEFHVIFQILKISAAVWSGGSFLLDVMPRHVIHREKKKSEMKASKDQAASIVEDPLKVNNSDNSKQS
ncbi:hypothetical protein Nepgr_018370 [Nepenthes gracilis]|uniref:Glycerophosphocholine acyltransferase 1 n=1 Tax=Nepenthes gracilis TaxID=150966 RepID=A0AAD3XTY9_NEPGR|nr:hypothetical protein Nepgr_018370 [Nepenthes gracilis]